MNSPKMYRYIDIIIIDILYQSWVGGGRKWWDRAEILILKMY